ncbi:polysaccharide deacetylase family protein [Sinorhizobium medicae]|uniref:Chitooligosaccharide deacetylase n=1 Tax=Sinorhizobium medicae TaxID=110321 RepID=A0A508X320_9HYPH|nr:polysaccharide deacetylase family protein [Sinorhizobium medicae]MDX0520381.1 polysaccharide deacetylase family protein [Sinorhizobium medicae]MDX0544976.1 polysaccharide deacetylase family protein [Sinorhizobium medicae]MDX0631158.1 polysaccharide deacetylase family protein [Sinorhizobium medicae]MDX0902129.1 polysaccharide deacetylase family protein [Sinorhizobium medicae]MDX1161693.1 polysaccharide deacetylase family protein [Sinorhizobium medicae]
MLERQSRIGPLVDRLANRAIWKLARSRRLLETDVPLVSFTFDDVPDSALGAGAAVLEKYEARGTFYIAGGLAGQVEPDRRLITPEGCGELLARGHEIGCHTFSHRRLRDIAGLGADLDRNDAYLKRVGVSPGASNFAFPYNAAWPSARDELRRRYRTCRAAGEAINRGAVDPMMLKGVEIRQPEHEARALTSWIDDVVERPGWLIFFTHDIAMQPTSYGCTPETFDHLVRYAVEKGCCILRVDSAADRIGW